MTERTIWRRASRPIPEWDVHALLRLMWDSWNAVFRTTLGHAERTYVSELRTARNNWAHQRRFSTDDAYRALDSTHRLLTSVSAPEAAEAEKMKMELLRLRFNEQARHVRRQGAQTALKIGVTSSLPGWRDVVAPHPDVASGRYNQAEFAADLWQDHVEIRQLADHYSRYTYLQRVEDPTVITEAVRAGAGLLTWEADAFAYAESYDEEKGRYRGLRASQLLPPLTADSPGLVVRPEVARKQMEAEAPVGPVEPVVVTGPDPGPGPPPGPVVPPRLQPKRFYGSVSIDPVRAGKVAGQIAEEVVAHLTGLTGSKVEVTLEIEAEIPDGAPEHVVRTVTENARTLDFMSQGFEEE